MSQAILSTDVESPFVFQDHPIRTVVHEETLWFVARDVCAALDITWTGATLANIPTEWSCMLNLNMIQHNRKVKFINEPAVYKLAFRSNKPEADVFTNWVASEVLPALRKTGKFEAHPEQTTPSISPATSDSPLTPDQQCTLQTIVKAKVEAIPKEQRSGGLYPQVWSRFNNHFRIAKYNQLPQSKLSEAIAYLMALEVREPKKALPAPDGHIDEAPYLKLVDDIQAAHEVVSKVTTPLYEDISRLSAVVAFALCEHGGIPVYLPAIHAANYLDFSLYRYLDDKTRDAMTNCCTMLDEYTNPGYALLGIVRQLNGARA